MDKSPVINDSEEFEPMGLPNAAPGQPAAKAAAGPAKPPPGKPGAKPMPGKPAPAAAPAPAPPPAPEPPPAPAPAASPVINDSNDFIPMPTPDQVVHMDEETRRLDTVPFEFADIRALALRILKRAQEQGQAKINSAKKQVAAMEKEAYDKAYAAAFEKAKAEGLETGRKTGIAESDKKIQQAIDAEKESLRQNAAPVSGVLEQLANALSASKDQLMAQAEGDLLLLSIDLAKRLVGHELSINPEAIKPLVTECIDLVTDRTSIDVRVNPADHQVMTEFYPELQVIFPDLGQVRIIPDPQIERGGLYAATREAEVDMRLATRLAAFEEVILGFSGEAAVAPWSQIPPDAIAEARAAAAESAYSLPMDDGPDSGQYHEEMSAEQIPHESPLADPAVMEQQMEQQMQAEALGGEPADAAAVADAPMSPEDAQAAVDMLAAAGAEGQGGEGASAQDLADLAELADMAGGDAGPPQ